MSDPNAILAFHQLLRAFPGAIRVVSPASTVANSSATVDPITDAIMPSTSIPSDVAVSLSATVLKAKHSQLTLYIDNLDMTWEVDVDLTVGDALFVGTEIELKVSGAAFAEWKNLNGVGRKQESQNPIVPVILQDDVMNGRLAPGEDDTNNSQVFLNEEAIDAWFSIEPMHPSDLVDSTEVAAHRRGSVFSASILTVEADHVVLSDQDGNECFLPVGEMTWSRRALPSSDIAAMRGSFLVEVLNTIGDWDKPIVGLFPLAGEPMINNKPLSTGDMVTCIVMGVFSFGVQVSFGQPRVETTIEIDALSRSPELRDPTRFSVGQEINACVLSVDRRSRTISLSIAALEARYEREKEVRRAQLTSAIQEDTQRALGGPFDEVLAILDS